MLRMFVCCSAFATLAMTSLLQPAAAGWLIDLGPGVASRQASGQVSGQVLGQVGTGIAGAVPPRAADYEGMIAQHAAANSVPASLIHRVIMRESRYNPRAVSMGNYGLMQIRLGTARAMGYSGSAAGLLNAETNMTYAVKYLAGAYRAAKGNEALAVALYARGYYARARGN
jgi:soluble lytic murein transglycosylase-like protein